MTERRDPELTDLKRRVANGTLIGTVSQVDHENARYRVKIGELETDWIPKLKARSGKTKEYEPLDEGEQVLVQSVSGDLSQGVIMGSIETQERQIGTKGTQHRREYPDGTVVDYDDDGGLSVKLAPGRSSVTTVGDVTVTTSQDGVLMQAGGVSAKVSSEGLAVTGGKITHNGVNIGSDHVHGGVVRGGADTLGPH